MRPALSIVFFTTSSGAGFALFLLLGLGAPLGLTPQSSGFGFVALAVAALLAGAGLVASLLHLGRPERAWRAFSQWRSSWLSREGVFAVLTFLPAAIFGIGWVFFGATGRLFGLCGILTAALAAATVYCTGMIYASLKPIHQWHNAWVVPAYLALGLMGGCLVLDFLVRLWSRRSTGIALLTMISRLCRVVDQGTLLAVHRHDAGAQHRGRGHDARQSRPGAAVRGAAYARKLSAAGDGLSPGAQACAAVAAHRPARRLCLLRRC